MDVPLSSNGASSHLVGNRGFGYSSALTRALEGSWDERDGQLYRRCDQTSLAKFSAVTGSYPTFPFAHSALANCALEAGADGWREHADRALEILRPTHVRTFTIDWEVVNQSHKNASPGSLGLRPTSAKGSSRWALALIKSELGHRL